MTRSALDIGAGVYGMRSVIYAQTRFPQGRWLGRGILLLMMLAVLLVSCAPSPTPTPVTPPTVTPAPTAPPTPMSVPTPTTEAIPTVERIPGRPSLGFHLDRVDDALFRAAAEAGADWVVVVTFSLSQATPIGRCPTRPCAWPAGTAWN